MHTYIHTNMCRCIHTLSGLEQDMICGSKFVVHVASKEVPFMPRRSKSYRPNYETPAGRANWVAVEELTFSSRYQGAYLLGIFPYYGNLIYHNLETILVGICIPCMVTTSISFLSSSTEKASMEQLPFVVVPPSLMPSALYDNGVSRPESPVRVPFWN